MRLKCGKCGSKAKEAFCFHKTIASVVCLNCDNSSHSFSMHSAIKKWNVSQSNYKNYTRKHSHVH